MISTPMGKNVSMHCKVIVLVVLACSPIKGFAVSDCANLESLSWIKGDWVHSVKQQESPSSKPQPYQVVEHWLSQDNGELVGEGRSHYREMPAGEITEIMKIIEMGGSVYYIAKPNSASLPTLFKLTSCSESGAVFENPAHDFPQSIQYELIEKNTLRASVAGEGGASFTITYTLFEQARPLDDKKS